MTQLGSRLVDYLAYATDHSPELRAEYERFAASVHRIAGERTLPDPMVEFGVFVWNSGENAGLTGARVGVKQEFPWPSNLSAGADVAAAEAQSQRRRLEARLLDLKWRVTEAYYGLWLIGRTREIDREQLSILQGLAESAAGQIAVGAATLADVQQIDLSVIRLEDALQALDEEEVAARAALRAAIGAPDSLNLTVAKEVEEPALPGEPVSALRQSVREHPALDSLAFAIERGEAMVRLQRAQRMPGLVVGVEWMRMPGEGGMSAISPNFGIKLPLFQGSYQKSIQAAQAESFAMVADRDGVVLMAHAELEQALAQLRDSHRRVLLNERTLLPQAEAAYASVLGAYATGRGSIAASLLAQRELLEIRVDWEKAHAEHLIAWARLEQIVGRAVERQAVE